MELIDIRTPPPILSPSAQRVLAYLQTHNLHILPDGSHPIDGEDFFVNLFTFTSQPPEQRIWEAHRQYIDVHHILSGSETIHHRFIQDSAQEDYHPETDYLAIAAQPPHSQFSLSAHYLAIFYPEDAHQTGISTAQTPSQTIRKAVFKIRYPSV